MIKNYMKVAFRNLKKYKFYSLLNVSGLAVGIACCLLILLFLQSELSYDTYHKNADNIYRIVRQSWAVVPLPLAPALAAESPLIKKVVRVLPHEGYRGIPLIKYQDKQFLEKRLFYADPEILDIFDFNFIKGDANTALTDPDAIILTESIATKFFGEAEPMGKVLFFQSQDGPHTFTVSGIIKEIPAESHFKFDLLARIEQYPFFQPSPNRPGLANVWEANICWTYILLGEKNKPEELESQLGDFVTRHYQDIRDPDNYLRLQKVTDIHLKSTLNREIEANGSLMYVYVFSIIAFSILIIACINFINLTTGRSAGRAKEVGMRKVFGAERSYLIAQFFGEALLLSFVACCLSILFVKIALPSFNNMMTTKLVFSLTQNVEIWTFLIGIFLFTAIISGSYPALFLSSFNPSKVLKGKLTLGSKSGPLRRVLVVGQLSSSIILLASIAVINSQLDFISNKNLGYDKEQIVFLRNKGSVFGQSQRYDSFKTELLKNTGIANVTASWSIPGSSNAPVFSYLFRTEDMTDERDSNVLALIRADHDFIDTFGIEVIEGRGLSKNFPKDYENAFLLSEMAVKELGWEGTAIGREIEAGIPAFKTGKVVGVFKDLHFESLYNELKPMAISGATGQVYRYVSIKINASGMARTIDFIEQTWSAFETEPLELFFLDSDMGELYQKDRKLATMVGYFTLLALFVACLGLLGMISFTAEQRVKEISIRKVLGAKISTITALLTREFALLVFYASCIAFPVGYGLMLLWLQNFAYRVDLDVWNFLLSGFLTLFLVLAIVSYRAIKTALLNPADSLKFE